MGQSFFVNRSDRFVVRWIPRCLIASRFHWKGKLFWWCVTVSCGRVILRAWDLLMLVLKIDRCWKSSKSFKRFGIDACGSLRNSKILSAKANLYVRPAMGMPLMSSLALRQHKRGSRVRTKRIGESGHPCLLPLLMKKAFDRWPLTQTLAKLASCI